MTEIRSTHQIPTTGENAASALRSLEHALRPTSAEQSSTDSARQLGALSLLQACTRLSSQIPGPAKRRLADLLPFSRADQDRFAAQNWSPENARVERYVARQVQSWLTDSPVYVNEREVHASDFLRWIEPYLDNYSRREDARRLAHQLRNPTEPLALADLSRDV